MNISCGILAIISLEKIIQYGYLFLLFLCWGSFLNVLSYRLITGISIISPPSHCISCKQAIAWFDNIPVISWIALRGTCRACGCSISAWYPILELSTALICVYAWVLFPPLYFYSYFIFISALLVTIRSDFETMLISRMVTLVLIPVAYLCSYIGVLPIAWKESMLASMAGWLLLFTIATIFYRLTGTRGIGQGDAELLATIGAFTGFYGIWWSFTLGSLLASCYGLLLIFQYGYQKYMRIPFGPFLASANLIYLFVYYYISRY